jgi:hypothetical protein
MPGPNQPATNAAADGIVTLLQGATFSDGVTPVYPTPVSTQYPTGGVQKGEFKDITDLIANYGAVAEVYGNTDDSFRYATGGVNHDEQTFFVLSIASLDNGNAAETLIFNIRDAVVPIFVKHAMLNVGGIIFKAGFKRGSGRWMRTYRNGVWYRSYLFSVEVKGQWSSLGGYTQ